MSFDSRQGAVFWVSLTCDALVEAEPCDRWVPRPGLLPKLAASRAAAGCAQAEDVRQPATKAVVRRSPSAAVSMIGWPYWEAAMMKASIPSMMRCSPNLKERAGSWAEPYSAPAAVPTRTATG